MITPVEENSHPVTTFGGSVPKIEEIPPGGTELEASGAGNVGFARSAQMGSPVTNSPDEKRSYGVAIAASLGIGSLSPLPNFPSFAAGFFPVAAQGPSILERAEAFRREHGRNPIDWRMGV